MNGFDLSTISSVYVGSTQYSSIYLGSTQIWPLNLSLPYDAEIEYLQSDGNPYINTEIYNNSDVIIDVKTSLSGKDRLSGSESSSSYRYKWGSNGSGYIYYGFGDTNYTSTIVADIATPYIFHLLLSLHYVKDSNDNIILSGSNSFSNFSTLPILLFRMSLGNSLVSLNGTGNTRIYYCNIQTSTTNLLLIPVRVGNVGYLYDKVSKRLFGNSGSGNFILGPEVSPIETKAYLENPNVENGSHIYVNKNFHFIPTHTYKVETKIKWLNNTSNLDGGVAFILGIGTYVKDSVVNGYSIYWHNSNNIYRNGCGVSYSNSGNSSTEKIISDQVTGLTNEYYLTIFSNIRAYQRRMTNALIYYVKITDVTTDTVICNLVPKYNATRNIYYMQDTTDNSMYQFITLGSSMREESDLTIYENET